MKRLGIAAALALAAAGACAGCSGSGDGSGGTGGTLSERSRHPLRGGFTPQRDYDPKVDVPVEKYADDPRKYNRYWDAETQGGTGVYEPWRDPMWTPRDEFGVM